MSNHNIDLSSFAEGAVAERFNQELHKVLSNISDPNTDPKKARSVTITVTLKADEQRDIANVSIQAKSTIAPARNIETKIVMDRDQRGNVVGAELKSGVKGQTFIDTDGDIAEDTGNKVVRFK
jgi:uncharacterized protein YuzE